MKKNNKRLLFYVIIAAFIAFFAFNTLQSFTVESYDTFEELVYDLQEGRIEAFTMNDNGECTVT